MTTINITINESEKYEDTCKLIAKRTREAWDKLQVSKEERGGLHPVTCCLRAKWSALDKLCRELGIRYVHV